MNTQWNNKNTYAVLFGAVLLLCAAPENAWAQKEKALKAVLSQRVAQKTIISRIKKVPIARKALYDRRLLDRVTLNRERRIAPTAMQIKANMKKQAAYQAAHSYHELKAFPVITPTKPADLSVHAYRLSPAQRDAEYKKYYELMDKFAGIKDTWNARQFYWQLYKDSNPMTTLEKQTLLRECLSLMSPIGVKLDFMFQSDVPLRQAYDYLVLMAEKLEPAYFGVFRRDKIQTREDRAFVEDQFFLRSENDGNLREVRWEDYSPSSADARTNALALAAQLPKNLKIALVNDDERMVGSFKHWASLGYLGEGAELSTYTSVEGLLGERKEFDVIVTDVLVPGGGGRYLAHLLRKEHKSVTPIIAMSAYAEQDCRAQELFNFGIDGYIFADDTFTSYIGYRVFPVLLKNYFDMKGRFNWEH